MCLYYNKQFFIIYKRGLNTHPLNYTTSMLTSALQPDVQMNSEPVNIIKAQSSICYHPLSTVPPFADYFLHTYEI